MPRSDPTPPATTRPTRAGGSGSPRAVSNFALKPAVAAENGTGNGPDAKDGADHHPRARGGHQAGQRQGAPDRSAGRPDRRGHRASWSWPPWCTTTPSAICNGQSIPTTSIPTSTSSSAWSTMALALVMLAAAWFRKRLFIGVASALYGLSFFNLHYWGFGVPVHPDRLVVPGARLPALAEAQAGQGGRRRAGFASARRPGAAPTSATRPQRPDPPDAQVQAGQGHRSRLSRACIRPVG